MGSGIEYQENISSVRIRTQFDRCAEFVLSGFHNFEEYIFKPGSTQAIEFWNNYPILALFLGILTVLASVPVISYILFSITVLVTFLAMAVGFAILSSLAIITTSGALLLISLFVFTLIALALTGFLLSLYISGRLLTLLITKDSFQQGAGQWYQEIKQHIKSEPSYAATLSNQLEPSQSSIVLKQEKTDDDAK